MLISLLYSDVQWGTVEQRGTDNVQCMSDNVSQFLDYQLIWNS